MKTPGGPAHGTRQGIAVAGLILLLAACLAPAALSSAPDKPFSARVEAGISLKGKTRDEARAGCVRQGKEKAIESYISSRAPAAVMDENKKAVKNILGRPENWVLSWELIEEREEEGSLVVELEVVLDTAKLDSALRAAGIIPSRPLPRTFIVVRGQVDYEAMPSGWDKSPEAGGTWNPCEAAIERELARFNFQVIPPAAGSAPVDAGKIIKPEGDKDKQELYKQLSDRFKAGALVVGMVDAVKKSGDKAPEKVEVTAKIAAADVEKGDVLFTDELNVEFEIKGVPFREEQISEVCKQAGAKAVAALFKAWTPKYTPGEERGLKVIVAGLGSYAAMKEMETRLREEGPGVKSAAVSRMSPGEIEFQVRTTVDAESMADWLANISVAGLRLSIESSREDVIEARAGQAP